MRGKTNLQRADVLFTSFSASPPPPPSAGFLDQLVVLFKDEDSSVRTKTCELLHLLTSHSIGR